MRRILVPFLIVAVLCGHVWAQSEDTAPVERTYPFSVDAVQKALQRIGGFGGGKLPVLDGFVTATDPERYDHPYFQYRVHLKSVDPNTTLVSVEAKISALFVNQDPAHPEYQALPSNGRLESDLHDRLQQALRATSAAPPMQPGKTQHHRSRNLRKWPPQKVPQRAQPHSLNWMRFWPNDNPSGKRLLRSRPKSTN